MAKRRKRGGVSFGTVFMLLVTVGCVGACAWFLSELAGDWGQLRVDAQVLIGALDAGVASMRQTDPGTAGLPVATHAESAAPTAAPTPSPVPTPNTITVNIAGQVRFDEVMRESGYSKSTQAYQFRDMLGQIGGTVGDADLTIITLDTLLAGAEAKYGNYNAPDALLDALKMAGVDVINLATDHTLDKGFEGLKRTADTIESQGFGLAGAARDTQEARTQLIFSVNDITVAYLAYTNELSSEGKKSANKDARAFAVPMLDADSIEEDVTRARVSGADLVIVAVHWGANADKKPSTKVLALADKLVLSGADLIIGTNPSYVHPIEKRAVTLRDGSQKDVYIAYSLGNFLTPERDDAGTITGMLLQFKLVKEHGAARVRVESASYLPTWAMRYRDDEGVYRFRIIPAGMTIKPDEMTDTVKKNMNKAYDALVESLGSEVATPRKE